MPTLRRPPRAPAAACLWLILVLALAAGAAAGEISGLVTDQAGRPLAGALVSDGHSIAVSGPDGAWRLDGPPEGVVSLCPPAGYAPPERWWRPAAELADAPWRVSLEAAPVPAQPRLAWLSDPHLFGPEAPALNRWSTLLDPKVPLAAWERTAAELSGRPPDLVLVTGDLAMDGDKGEPAHTRAQLALAARALAALPGPVRALPGNHDVRYDGGRVDYAAWRGILGPVRHLARLGPAVVILLDNTGLGADPEGGPRSCGALGEQASAWLEAALAALPADTPLLVASHYPMASPLAGANPLEKGSLVRALAGPGLALRDVDQGLGRLSRLLAGRRLVALLNGHEHAHQESTVFTAGGPWRLIGAPAVCGRWWYGDLARDGLRFPSAYLAGDLRTTDGASRLELREVAVKYPVPLAD